MQDIKKCCALSRCFNTSDLKLCANCGVVAYCSKEHQAEHFKDGGHKMICPGRTKGNPLTFQECLEKASKYYSQQMWLAAIPYYSAMLELTERQVGILHVQNANLLDVIAICYRNLEKYEFAVQCLQRCILIREMDNDGSDEKNQACINLLGRLSEYSMLGGQLQLAKEFLKKTEEQASTVFGDQSFQRGKVLNSLAVCHDQLDEYEDAVKCLTTALSLTQYINATKEEDMLQVSNAHFNLGIIYAKHEKYTEALTQFQACKVIKEKLKVPEDDNDMKILNENLLDVQTRITA